MNLTAEETAALQAMVKNFKCPVCGNTHIDFNEFASFKALYSDDKATVEEWIRVATGHCSWCGWMLEFNMDKVMASYSIILGSKK